MTKETEVIKKDNGSEKKQDYSEVRLYMPYVNIYENDSEIILEAEMPGVDEKGAEVLIENNILTIEGLASTETPMGCGVIEEEYLLGRYKRTFDLSDCIIADEIRAKMKNGILKVVLPKKNEVKARKIKVSA